VKVQTACLFFSFLLFRVSEKKVSLLIELLNYYVSVILLKLY